MSVILASPVYTLGSAATGATWQGNVTDDSGVDWIVEDEAGWSSSPPVRPQQEDKSAGDGAWQGPGAYAARVITLSGTAIAPSQTLMLWAKEAIKAAASPRALAPLQVDEAHLSRMVMVRQTDDVAIKDLGRDAFTFSLIMTAADPARYSIGDVPQSTGLPATSVTGWTYPRVYPRLYGGSGGPAQGSVVFVQEGNYDATPATITFSGPLITPTVAHVQTGRTLSFDLTLGQYDTLIVDLAAGTALLNGTASRAGTLTPGSAWFLLVPGSNELQFRGAAGATTDGSTPNPQMTVAAASAWT
jgi:hypothetical protein